MKKWVLDKDAVELISSMASQEEFGGLALQEAFVEDENGGYEFGLLAFDAEDEEEGAVTICPDQNLCFNKLTAEEVGYKWANDQLNKIIELVQAGPKNEARDLFSAGVLRALHDVFTPIAKI